MDEDFEAEEGDWEEWQEDDEAAETMDGALCLFCPMQFPSASRAFAHMRDEHQFDFQHIRSEKVLTYYDSVRIINFVRRQVALSRCIACGAQFEQREILLAHMQSSRHFWLPIHSPPGSSEEQVAGASRAGNEGQSGGIELWSDDLYLRPVLEDDSLLYSFEGEEQEDYKEDELEIQGVMEEGRQALAQVAAAKANSTREIGLGGSVELAGGNSPEELSLEIEALRRKNKELKERVAELESGTLLKARRVPKTPHPTPVSSPSPGFNLTESSPPRDLPSSLDIVREVEGEEDIPEEEEEDFAEGEAKEEEQVDEDFDEDCEGAESSHDSLQSTRKALGVIVGPGDALRGGHLTLAEKRIRDSEREERTKIEAVDSSYFKSYGTFGIHREMLSDEPRTAAYQAALLENRTLLQGATVLDVGCGTGILSLFAAKAGAAKVVAVDASEKIASVAAKIADDNGYLEGSKARSHDGQDPLVAIPSPVISVVCGVVEDLSKAHFDEAVHLNEGGSKSAAAKERDAGSRMHSKVAAISLQKGGVDVLVSEWMGYCLLYESMLSTVLRARDVWLKPGGAILPDIATMYLAGFGKGGTSLAFWENVYGFDMSCVGNEVNQFAAEAPLIDALQAKDVITTTCPVQTMDLSSIKIEELDFTSYFHLTLLEGGSLAPAYHELADMGHHLSQRPQPDASQIASMGRACSEGQWCYGVVVWFDVRFSERYCKEKSVLLSTSPFAPLTHWSQTLLTFREPILLANAASSARHQGSAVQTDLPINKENFTNESGGSLPSPAPRVGSRMIGTSSDPAVAISGRFSIARSSRHRSIDISLETAAVSSDGNVRRFPAQLFDLA